MPNTSATNTPAPVQVGQGAYQYTQTASTCTANDGDLLVGVLPVDFNTSKPVSPYSEPLYRRPTIYHRAGGLTSAAGLGQDSTALPTAVPTWEGFLSANVTAGATTCTVQPLADYGTPPSGAGMLYVLDTGAACEVFTVTAAPTGGPQGNPAGGPGLPWTLTRASLTFGNHTRLARVACIGTSQTAALDCGGHANGLPSGAVGGRGCKALDLYCLLLGPTGTAATAATAQFQLWVWNDLEAAWFIADTPKNLACAAAGTDTDLYRVDVQGRWFLVTIPAVSGTGGTTNALARVSVSQAWP